MRNNTHPEFVTHRSVPAPLPEPSFKARAFMPEDKPDPRGTIEPDEAVQAWSNRMQAAREIRERQAGRA